MSGWILVHGQQTDRKDVERMFAKIAHRGPYLRGLLEDNRVTMAQNYLAGDVNGAKATEEVPVRVSNLAICYDGQMGNGKKLASQFGVPDGDFREERLMIELYRRHGPRMFAHLDDAIYAFAISDGKTFLAARDLLGIKTLFYGWKGSTLYLASELKSVLEATDNVREFPPGHMMNEKGDLVKYAQLPETPPPLARSEEALATGLIRDIVKRSVRSRIDFTLPTGCLLSGGIDSSVITYLASDYYREIAGGHAKLKTFALGVGESEDICTSRIMAHYIRSEHHEILVNLEQMVSVLPDVIYYLESFDPSLVRSAVSNFLVSRYAKRHGIEVLLSGEGGDEVFCGYTYLKQVPMEELFARQMECIGLLHNNASLRLDRMNHCHSVRVVAPLISGELLVHAMALPPEYKQKPHGNDRIEKWILRKAFAHLLPEPIVWRLKKEFSQGSGSADVLPGYFEEALSDDALVEAQAEYPFIRSKEELYYFNIFSAHFGTGSAVETVGQWVSI